MTLFPKVVKLLRDKGAGDVLVFGGGIIPRDDIPKLAEAGIERIFTPGASTGEIVDWLNERLADQCALITNDQSPLRERWGGWRGRARPVPWPAP